MNDQIEPSIPQIILDDFKIKKLIGEGAFSHIFSAENKKTKKEVAIKAYINSEDTYIIRGINVSCVNIPGLVKTIGYRKPIKNNDKELSRWKKFTLKSEVGESSEYDLSGWIVIMEYYKNNDLLTLTRNYLQSRNIDAMNPTIRSKIIFGVASIMKQLHQNNAIYRDLKPSNVFLTDNFEPVIGDFELSKFVIDPLSMTMGIGTPIYMAPEIISDEYDLYSFSADVYSYGIFLYQMFAKEIKFDCRVQPKSIFQYMKKITENCRPVKIDTIPDHYWELIKKCWDKTPDNRPTFAEIVEILRNDKFALHEFGMKTNLDELHEYQNRIEGIEQTTATSHTKKDSDEIEKSLARLKEYESLLSYPNDNPKEDNCFIGEEEEKFHELIEKVGEGATSITYKIVDKKTDQIMCKKVLKECQNDQNAFKTLQNSMKEFEVQYRLNHPCICKVYSINTCEPVKDSKPESTTIAMFLEFLDFKLNDVLKSDIKNTLKVRIIIEIAHAMKFIHSKGLIHRDLKIENIMLNSVYEAKVVDFGLVRIHEFLNQEYSFVQDSMTRGVGTFAYMSPEMLNEEKYDYKTDVYSFGILVYYMFTGKLPKQNLKDKMNGIPINLPNPSDSISKFCIELIKKCLSFDSLKRPSFDDIINDIRKNNYLLASNIDQSVVFHRDHELELFETK